MCKPRASRASGNEHSSDTTNVGLLNMSKNSGDGLDATDIVTYVICAIVVFMVFKWAKKCMIRRLAKAQVLPPAPQQPLPMPPAPPVMPSAPPVHQAIQYQPLSVPALPQPTAKLESPAYRVIYRPGSICEEATVEDSMQKYR